MNSGGDTALDYFLMKKADAKCYEKLEIYKSRIWVHNKINFIEKETKVMYFDNHLMQAKLNFFKN